MAKAHIAHAISVLARPKSEGYTSEIWNTLLEEVSTNDKAYMTAPQLKISKGKVPDFVTTHHVFNSRWCRNTFLIIEC